MNQLEESTVNILTQLADLAEKLSDEDFSRDLPVLLNNSIGKHYRHIIEFYGILLAGLRSGMVNYDSRKHDPELEQDRGKCMELLKRIRIDLFSSISGREMELRVCYSMNTDDSILITTNMHRELVYNIEHAIHHMAIIRIALQHDFRSIVVDQHFGFAYSTIKHLNS